MGEVSHEIDSAKGDGRGNRKEESERGQCVVVGYRRLNGGSKKVCNARMLSAISQVGKGGNLNILYLRESVDRDSARSLKLNPRASTARQDYGKVFPRWKPTRKSSPIGRKQAGRRGFKRQDSNSSE